MITIDKVALVIIRDRKVLYLRSKGKDAFYNPGGKRKAGETDVEALLRELDEELGLTIDSTTVRYLETFRAQAHGKPEGTFVEIKCYEAAFSGEPTPRSEIEELAWFGSADHHRTSATGALILEWLVKEDRID